MINPADIILVRGSGPISEAIEHITHSPYSHLAIIAKQNELIEAQTFRRTGYQGLDFYAGCADVFTCDQLTDDQRQRIVAYVMSCVGERYDYELIALEAEHFLLHTPIHYDEHGRHICSTLGSDGYRREGIDPCPGIADPVPADWGVSRIMRKSGSF